MRFYWLPDALPQKHEQNDLVEQIVKLIAAHLPPRKFFSTISIEYEDFAGTPLDSYLDNIVVTRADGCWITPDAAFISDALEALQQRIADKDQKKATTYLANCHRVWLMIVAEGESVSSMVVFPDDLPEYPFEFGRFERVLFYNRMVRRVTDLKRKTD
ncbi:MAG: hypothetical protein ACYC7E_19815 [Armatimonadota bacterium]